MIIKIVSFAISFGASTLGAIAGFGGGVIIKPVMDAFGLLPVSSVSFLSGCTALAMAVASLIKQRKNDIKLEYRTSTPLALGAVIGGLFGKYLFELVRTMFADETVLGGIQAVCLTLITLGVFLYICKKDQLRSFHTENLLICLLIGSLLGIISSFLGIGGGTSNIAILFLCFSMDAKTAAKNSLYIIVFSQTSSIVKAILSHTVPTFEWTVLILMAAGGIAGAMLGSKISSKISNKGVEYILRTLLVIIILIDASNVLKFFLMQ